MTIAAASVATGDIRHVIFVPISLRSHLRLLLQLINSLLAVAPPRVVATILVTSTIDRTLQVEFARLAPESSLHEVRQSGRLRVEVIEDHLSKDSKVVDEKIAFKRLARPSLEKLLCVHQVNGKANGDSDADIKPFPRPRMIIGDVGDPLIS